MTAARAAELFHHEVMTKGFVRAKGWDLAGGRIEAEFDDPDLVQFSFDELATLLEGSLAEARRPLVEALPESVGDVACAALLLDELVRSSGARASTVALAGDQSCTPRRSTAPSR